VVSPTNKRFSGIADEDEADLKEIEQALEAEDEDNIQQQGGVDEDSWFPSSRDCQCCKGYIYRCTCANNCCVQCGAAAASAVAHEENDEEPNVVESGAADWAPWKDEWFPASRNCANCKGYRYRVPGESVCSSCSDVAATSEPSVVLAPNVKNVRSS